MTDSDFNNPVLKRNEFLEILSDNAYGRIPGVFCDTVFRIESADENEVAGKADISRLVITADTGNGSFEFPAVFINNRLNSISPVIVFINFRKDIYDKYCPVEEILDNGFSLIQIYYEDITDDNDDFSDKLASYYDRNHLNSPGKISLWAWAVSRVVDIIKDIPSLDAGNIALIGHSRLGKTALWCAANDTRIKYVCSNCSGCMGAAYNGDKHENAETYEIINKNFHFWFCNKFSNDVLTDKTGLFDQDMLISAIAPRYVLINSAKEDLWADPPSELLSCRLASAVWEEYDKTGLVFTDDIPKTDVLYGDGSLAYHIRNGTHFLSRNDWNAFMKFIKSKYLV